MRFLVGHQCLDDIWNKENEGGSTVMHYHSLLLASGVESCFSAIFVV